MVTAVPNESYLPPRLTAAISRCHLLASVWNVMAHVQKLDFVFRWNGRVHLNRRGCQFSRLLAAELCTSACRVCTARASLCSAVMWRLLFTNSILLFPLHFSSRALPCAITFQLDSTNVNGWSYTSSLLYPQSVRFFYFTSSYLAF